MSFRNKPGKSPARTNLLNRFQVILAMRLDERNVPAKKLLDSWFVFIDVKAMNK